MKVSAAGDCAVLCDVADIDTAHRLRRAIVDASLACNGNGVVDVVPAWQSVLVTFAEPIGDLAVLTRQLQGLDLPPSDVVEGILHEIAVSYEGPDLDVVARHTGLTADEVVRRHVAPTYTVAFLGFLPGFPYLAGMDPALTVPRRDTPRTCVLAGAVGIADDVTGIYPREAPGGWQLIGRTDVTLFDVDAQPPTRLAPGDRVRFIVTR